MATRTMANLVTKSLRHNSDIVFLFLQIALPDQNTQVAPRLEASSKKTKTADFFNVQDHRGTAKFMAGPVPDGSSPAAAASPGLQ